MNEEGEVSLVGIGERQGRLSEEREGGGFCHGQPRRRGARQG